MQWAVAEFSRKQVDEAGRTLISESVSNASRDDALEVVNNWRAAHSFPLNTFQVTLRQRSRDVSPRVLVAQRLKRVPSIIQKLQRFPTMNLSRMQDIGGCRAVVEDVDDVRRLRGKYSRSREKHIFRGEKDYIDLPKESGYRGVHLVYEYSSRRTPTHDGRLIEIQIRSRLQHEWATAVETVDTFLRTALKSSEGPARWLRFFSLTGSAFALSEGTPPVPNTPTSRGDLIDEIVTIEHELGVRKVLKAYGHALRVFTEKSGRDDYYFLLWLLPPPSRLTVHAYRKTDLANAIEHYLQLEKASTGMPGSQAVLVAADSLMALQRAYPNYYLDTEAFVVSLGKVLRKG